MWGLFYGIGKRKIMNGDLRRICIYMNGDLRGYLYLHEYINTAIILFLTVSKNKIAAIPENIGAVTIVNVVLNYSILCGNSRKFYGRFLENKKL